MLKPKYFIFSIIALLFLVKNEYAYSQACDPQTPTYYPDLTGSPDSLWQSPSESRAGVCCGVNGGPPDNYRCVEFYLTLDENAEGIRFDVASGAKPSGSMGWSVNCGPLNPVGENICLDGVGPHWITFCKPGNNPNSYTIKSIPKPSVSPPTVVSNSCTSTLTATGYIASTIRWRSEPENPVHNSYLNCLVGCPTVTATFVDGAPDSVVYIVSGIPEAGCNSILFENRTTVYFVNDKTAEILPQDPMICFGGTFATITAHGTGGWPPLQYRWSTGETTQSIDVGVGTYEVEIYDNTGCPSAMATVTVGAYTSAIVADAGPDITGCVNNPTTTVTGSIQQATGGIWSGGNGTYAPSNTSLVMNYTPTPDEITNGVTLTLTSTGNGGCPEQTDQMTITFAPAPIVSAGNDATICASNASVQLNGTVTNAGGGTWTGGTGTFIPNANTLNAVYYPSTAEIDAGTVTLTLTSTGAGLCLPVSDQMTVSISAAPTVDPGTAGPVCANNPVISLNGNTQNAIGASWSGGTGTFANANALSTTYTPSANDINNGSVTLTLTTTGSIVCPEVSQQVTVPITPAPTVNAGNDRTICANNATFQLNGTVTVATGGVWSLGNGTFADINSLTSNYTPSETEISNGGFTLRLTTTGNGNCNAVHDEVNITVVPAPILTSNNTTVCANNPAALFTATVENAAGVQWSAGSGTYIPSNTALELTYIPSAQEISNQFANLNLRSTGNGSCIPVLRSYFVIIEPAPTVNAGIDQSICANNTAVQLDGEVMGTATFTWTTNGTGSFSNPNEQKPVYTPSQNDIDAGTVTLTLTATRSLCFPVQDQMTITILPAPIVDAGPDVPGCTDNSSVSLNGTILLDGNPANGVWSTSGTGTFDPNPETLTATYIPSPVDNTTGIVTLTLTSEAVNNCLPVSDNLNIDLSLEPVAYAGDDINVCANNLNIVLNGSVIGAQGGTWTGGNGTFSPNRNTLDASYSPTQAEIDNGSVTLTLTTIGVNNCPPSSDDVTITISPAPTVDAGPDQQLCSDIENVSLNGSVTVATDITWSGGLGSFSNATNLATSYTQTEQEILNESFILTLTATHNNCLPVSDNVQIRITPKPVVSAGSDLAICGIDNEIQLYGNIEHSSGGVWYTTGTGTFTDPNSTITTYISSAEDRDNGFIVKLESLDDGICSQVTDSISIVFVPEPELNMGPGGQVCTSEFPIQLEASGSPAIWTGGNGVFSPSDNALNARYTPTEAEIAAGTITLLLTTIDDGTCPPISEEVTYTIPPGPVVSAGSDQETCGSSTVSLVGTQSNASAFLWTSSGSGSFSNSTSLTSTYTPSAADVANGSVILTLATTVTDNGCENVSDNMVVNITPPLSVFAGNPQNICADISTPIQLNPTLTNTGNVTWSGGAGTFADANNPFTTYTLAESERSLSSITLTLTAHAVDACPEVTSPLTINIAPRPIINVTVPSTVCSNVSAINIEGNYQHTSGGFWSTDGSGTFDNPYNATTNYNPSATDIANGVTLNFVSNIAGTCQTYEAEETITFIPESIITVGPDAIQCANNMSPINLTGTRGGGATTSVWTTTGNGGLTNENTLSATYTPTTDDIALGTVRFYLTSGPNNPCPVASDSILLTITPAPTISVADRTICADAETVGLTAVITNAGGVEWTTNGAGSFSSDTDVTTVYNLHADDIDANNQTTVTFTVTTTDVGLCTPVSDDLTLTILPRPIVSVLPLASICSDAAGIQLGASSTTGSGYWSTENNTGSFQSSNTDLNAFFMPSQTHIANGSATIRFTSTNNGLCRPVQVSNTLTIIRRPIVNAGPSQTLCETANAITLNATVTPFVPVQWTSNGTGSFDDENELSTIYNPTDDDKTNQPVILTLTATNPGCDPVSHQMLVNFIYEPLADAGPDREACIDQSGIVLNGTIQNTSTSLWTTSGTGTFTPSANQQYVLYNFSADDKAIGSVQLTLRADANSHCQLHEDVTNITITPFIPEVSIAEANICSDAASVDLSSTINNAGGVIWTTSGTGTFSPDAESLTPSYAPSGDDITNVNVVLTVTTTGNGGCNAASATVNLNIVPGPLADAGDDDEICADRTQINLNGTIQGNATGGRWTSTGGGFFMPMSNIHNPTYIPSQADRLRGYSELIYTTTGTGTCLPHSDTIEIIITPAPTISAGSDREMCVDNISIDLQGDYTVAGGGSWSTVHAGVFSGTSVDGRTTTFTPDNSEKVAGNVIEIVYTSEDNGNCMAVRDTVRINMRPAPTVDIGQDVTFCSDVDEYLLFANVQHSNGGKWMTTGTGTFTHPNNVFTSYILSDLDKTPGGAFELSFRASSNTTCDSVEASKRIDIYPSYTLDAGGDQTVCNYVSDVLLNGTFTVASGAVWTRNLNVIGHIYNNETEITYTATEEERGTERILIYLSTIDDGVCTPIYDSLWVNFAIPPALPDDEKIVCNGSPTTISVQQLSNIQYSWSDGMGVISTTNSANVTANNDENTNQSFSITLTDNNLCEGLVNFTLRTYPPPQINLTNVPACQGDIITLNAQPDNILVVGNDREEYEWSLNNEPLNFTSPTIQVLTPGTYYVTYKIGDCMANGSSEVNFSPLPVVNGDKEKVFCDERGGTAEIDAGDAFTYEWETLSQDRTITVNEPGYYSYTVYNQYNCPAQDSVLVRVACPPRLFVPNAIKPNDDSRDAFMDILSANIGKFKLTIFNRWGEIIFQTEDHKNLWDGTYKNEPMPIGVYPWVLYYEGDTEEYRGPYQEKGSVTVVR